MFYPTVGFFLAIALSVQMVDSDMFWKILL